MSDIMSGVMACHISCLVSWHVRCHVRCHESSYFFYLGPHANFQNPRTTFENTPLFPPKYSIVEGLGAPMKFFGTLQQPFLGF